MYRIDRKTSRRACGPVRLPELRMRGGGFKPRAETGAAMSEILIPPERAHQLLAGSDALAIDCRTDVAAPGAANSGRGARDHALAHLPGAVYASLDTDLSDLSAAGAGRHPLPSADAFGRTLSRFGVAPGTHVIAYDDGSGAFAARLWWMLRMAGHRNVAVLDGGWAAWKEMGLPVESGQPERTATRYEVRFDPSFVVSAGEVAGMLAAGSGVLLDARAANRFRGENETIDPVAGHVPGARNRPYMDNLDASGRFRTPDELRAAFREVLGETDPARVVHMCGSGVTACHNLVAMEHAGLRGSRLYAGSWSGWISDPSRPVATGEA